MDDLKQGKRIVQRWVIGCESLGIVHDEATWEDADEWRWAEGARRYPGVRLDLMRMGMEVPRRADACECFAVPEERQFVYYGHTEPGSMMEPNPDCPVHGAEVARG